MDVSGDDFASSFTYDFSHDYRVGKVRVQVRGVDGHGYVKSGAAGWRTIKNYGVESVVCPVQDRQGSRATCKYLGAVRVDRQDLTRSPSRTRC